MARDATHLLVKGLPACGQDVILSASREPHLVTCGNCQRTIAMADAEARIAVDPQRKRNRKERS